VSDRQRRTDLDVLERELADLGRHLDTPPASDLAHAVRERIATAPVRPSRWWSRRPSRPALTVVAAGLIMLLVAAGILLWSPDARSAVAERLGLPGVTIVHLPGEPPPAATPSEVNVQLELGERAPTMDDVRARVSYPVLLPHLPELGPPDELYVGSRPAGGQVALVYRARPGLAVSAETGIALLVTQFQGRLEPALFGKGLPPGSRVEQTVVNGRPAYWIEGRPHLFIYRDRAGAIADERVRLAGNVLLWEQDGLTLRLEGAAGALSKEQALHIAASVR
jgi:hypothetical protein